MSLYKIVIKPVFFLFKAETIHGFTSFLMEHIIGFWPIKMITSIIFRNSDERLSTELFGLQFANKIGLAAGFDKNARLFHMMDAFGFGFVEVGTVTPKPQNGNDKPRLFRLKKDRALINRMGFNNDGVEGMKKRLRKRKRNLIVGVNIGKNKTTPLENAVDDYVFCFNELFDEADYFVVNVSSPNTPNLRSLQDKGPLKNILGTLSDLNAQKEKGKPLLLKIAPDLTDGQLDDIVEIALELKLDGIIATNTTISRADLITEKEFVKEMGNGGLSGAPLKRRSSEVIKYLKDRSQGSYKIIGVGGIETAEDAQEKLEAGADLVQVYSGFIYEGPGMVRRILKGCLS